MRILPPLCRGFVSLVLAAAAAGCAGGSSRAQSPREFFAGKTIIYIVATEAGGGYDAYGRLVSQYLGKHLGAGRVVVKNVPGGGHIVGTNELYHARPDGLTLGTFNSGLIYAQLLQRRGLQARLDRMSWVGKAGGEPRLLVTSVQSGFRTLADIRRAGRPLLIGAGGIGTEGYIDATLLAAAVGLQTRVVLGLATRDSQLSMMRGDTEAQFISASSSRPLIAGGFGHVVMRVGSGAGVDEDVPEAGDLVTTPNGARLVALIRAVAALSRWTAGPPGVPAERLEALRAAHASALADPDFLNDARRLDLPIQEMGGAALADTVTRVLSQPDDTLTMLAAASGEPGTPAPGAR